MFELVPQWLDKILNVDSYELFNDEIVSAGLIKQSIIKLQDIHTWQSFYIGGGGPAICIEFNDGHKVDYDDKYEMLFQILRKVAAGKELPFFHE